jgi:hypothetical protein
LKRSSASAWCGFLIPYPSDHDLPWISPDDIGDVAARYLLDRHWAGQWTQNLMEPENLTLLETCAILSQVLGYPVKFEGASIESLQQQFAAMGATADVRREMGDSLRISSGEAVPTAGYANANAYSVRCTKQGDLSTRNVAIGLSKHPLRIVFKIF